MEDKHHEKHREFFRESRMADADPPSRCLGRPPHFKWTLGYDPAPSRQLTMKRISGVLSVVECRSSADRNRCHFQNLLK